MKSPKIVRICASGHQYYKSSDCPTYPTCESERKPKSAFLAQLSAPARRTLESVGITASLPKLKEALVAEGLAFRSR